MLLRIPVITLNNQNGRQSISALMDCFPLTHKIIYFKRRHVADQYNGNRRNHSKSNTMYDVSDRVKGEGEQPQYSEAITNIENQFPSSRKIR